MQTIKHVILANTKRTNCYVLRINPVTEILETKVLILKDFEGRISSPYHVLSDKAT